MASHSQLSSIAATAGLSLLSALAMALLAVTLYIMGVLVSFAVFCIEEFAWSRRAHDRPPLVGTMFRMLKNFDRLFDEHVEYALAHRTSRLLFPGHSQLYTSDPQVIEHVLKNNFNKYSKGDFNTQVMKDLFGNGIFATDGEKWRHQRKLASHEFSTRVLRDFSSGVFRINAAKLTEKISSAAANRTSVDMQKVREDILTRFILASKEDPEMMNDRYLRDIVLNFLIAGKDTTANTLTWFFYMLCKNPVVQDKVALEINESLEWSKEDNSIENFTVRLNESAIENMHYLHAAITETLRLYPAVALDGKMADEDDMLPNGYRVVKGDGVNYMIYAMGRMTELWGKDAEEFKPERWLVNGAFQHESPYKFAAFNAGPRICLGKEFAYRQMKIMAATLLHFFRFKLEDESKEPTYKVMFTLHIDKGLHLYAYPRSA